MQEQINRLLNTIDDSIGSFIDGLPAAEKDIYASLLEMVKQLELDRLGGIKNNLANIRLLGKIQKAMQKMVLSKPYLQKVKSFVESFGTVASLNNDYMAAVFTSFTPMKVLDEIKKVNIQVTVDQLTESGIAGNFANDIKDILKRHITSGGSYKEMTQTLRDAIVGQEGEDGRLVKYAKQITTDSINQYNAQYIKAISDDLGLEWFAYRGSTIKTSRPFCVALKDRRYFHVSEIPGFLNGNVGGTHVHINPKTGLPDGMIEDTNPDNFIINRGGYQCRHQVLPVPKANVPEELLAQFSSSA